MRSRAQGSGLGIPRWRRLAGATAAALLAAGVVACRSEARANAPAEPVRVITHTRQYCEELSARAAVLRQNAPAAPAEAQLLAAEGDRLCGQGQIRPGIIRLRRAIMLLRAPARHDAPGR